MDNISELSKKVQEFLKNIQKNPYVAQQIVSLSQINMIDIYQREIGNTGLENLGNSCYMNSIIQCLRHTMCLNHHLLTQQTQNVLVKNLDSCPNINANILFIVNYIKIVYTMWTNNSKMSPISFKLLLGLIHSQFANRQQHDAHELLVKILQSFHDTLARNVKYRITGEIITDTDMHVKKAHDDWIKYYKNKHSIILDIFSGQLRTETQCQVCQKISYRFDPFLIIDLPALSGANLEQCFDQFVAVEQLIGENLYQCETCHAMTNAHKKITLWTLPQVLIIKFSRFQHQFTAGGHYHPNKISGPIDYPVTNFDLSKYISFPLSTQTKYHLYAVSCHHGTMGGGHYYAICHNQLQNVWINYNDERSSIIQNPVCDDAYILFYEKN